MYPPSIEGHMKTSLGKEFLRVKFRLWSGRGTPIERVFKQEVFYSLKALMEANSKRPAAQSLPSIEEAIVRVKSRSASITSYGFSRSDSLLIVMTS